MVRRDVAAAEGNVRASQLLSRARDVGYSGSDRRFREWVAAARDEWRAANGGVPVEGLVPVVGPEFPDVGRVVLVEVRGADGGLQGLASYPASEVERRRAVLPRVALLGSYWAWRVGAESGLTVAARSLPAGSGERTFHWFSHGVAGAVLVAGEDGGMYPLDADELVDLVGDRLRGFDTVRVWPCQTAPVLDREAALRLAARINARTGYRVYVPEWGTALDENPGTGGVEAHTLPGPDGDETGWVSVSSEHGAVQVPVVPVEGEASAWPTYPDPAFHNAYPAPYGPGRTDYAAHPQDSFHADYAATVADFPVVARNAWRTVWGQGADDPELRVFVAESRALGGLRGQYDAGPPKAGRVGDRAGRLYAEGPAWNWYLPGHSAPVASSRPETDAGWAPAEDAGAPVSVPSPYPVVDRPAVSPSATAALPELLAAGPPHALKWRADEAPLYKFSERPPEEVLGYGLLPKGGRLGHLIEHVYHNSADTGYVSTSRNRYYLRDSALNDPGSAPWLYGRYRYRYDVVLPGGIDVNATLDIASPFPDQEEVAFPGGIRVRFIRGVQPLQNGSPVGGYIPNPAFDPSITADDVSHETAWDEP